MNSIFNLIQKTLTFSHQLQALWLLICILALAGLELLGVGAFFPFLSLLSQPESIQEQKLLSFLYEQSGMNTDQEFLFLLGALLLILLLMKNALSAYLVYYRAKFSFGLYTHLSQKLLGNYLKKPYPFHLKNHSSSLLKNTLEETRNFRQVLLQMIIITTEAFVFTGLLGMMMFVDLGLTMLGAFLAFMMVSVLSFSTKKHLLQIGAQSEKHNRQMFQYASQAFQGIKDLKILGRYSFVEQQYTHAIESLAKYQVQYQLFKAVPGLLIQSLVYGSLFAVILYLLQTNDSFVDTIPILGVFALSFQRMMPAINQAYSGISMIRHHQPAIQILEKAFAESDSPSNLFLPSSSAPPIQFEHDISLKQIHFSYEGSKQVLQGVDLTIPKNHMIGIVGSSGSGKSTLLDIFLGLLPLSQGELQVDGKRLLSSQLSEWQKIIGYIPQSIFIMDDTVAANIAFALPPEEVDADRIQKVIQLAQLEEVVAHLEHGIHTRLGERGVSLSGGQQQRIGIARALYHDPDIIVMDEATSALDHHTEHEFQQAIEALAEQKTIIIVAHRLSTVQKCDCIYVLDQGLLAEQGTFEELSQTSSYFQTLSAQVECL